MTSELPARSGDTVFLVLFSGVLVFLVLKANCFSFEVFKGSSIVRDKMRSICHHFYTLAVSVPSDESVSLLDKTITFSTTFLGDEILHHFGCLSETHILYPLWSFIFFRTLFLRRVCHRFYNSGCIICTKWSHLTL